MIPSYISPLFNHLWQSTLVAIAAAMLAFTLRKNHARTRYWLWLVASVKFLVPFSLLVATGSRLGWPSNPAIARPQFSSVMEQISQPFALPAAVPIRPAGDQTSAIPAILFAVWACGFIGVVFIWWIRWQRIRAAVRSASVLALDAEVPVLSSPATLEPGVFGVIRPVLLLPEGITQHLAPAQLKAILAHELCHVRRRDNLAAAIHMLVEAMFWFHPLVWWIGARLVEERERACDEEVLQMGSEPQVYAESILKTCQFYLESPLACMSGVTGSDLKQRIVRIMTHRVAYKLNFGRKLLLAAAGVAAIAGPIAYGLANAPQSQSQPQTSEANRPTFDVASIKPSDSSNPFMSIRDTPGGRYTANGISVKLLIQNAYNVHDFQISGGPNWINSAKYDIVAKADETSDENAAKLTEDQRDAFRERQRLRLQSLLEERFQLKFHSSTKELPIYALVVAKDGPKIQEAKDGPDKNKGSMMMRPGQLTARGLSMFYLAANLSNQVGRVVLDKTGLSGLYDFTLQWTPDRSQMGSFGGGPGPGQEGSRMPPPPDPDGPSIFTALQEQLGLKLEPQEGPVEIFVIDHVEKPSEN
ncbi:MAG: M56 and DUF3738 domain-containing protein [Bryobacteraceae bacterium]